MSFLTALPIIKLSFSILKEVCPKSWGWSVRVQYSLIRDSVSVLIDTDSMSRNIFLNTWTRNLLLFNGYLNCHVKNWECTISSPRTPWTEKQSMGAEISPNLPRHRRPNRLRRRRRLRTCVAAFARSISQENWTWRTTSNRCTAERGVCTLGAVASAAPCSPVSTCRGARTFATSDIRNSAWKMVKGSYDSYLRRVW